MNQCRRPIRDLPLATSNIARGLLHSRWRTRPKTREMTTGERSMSKTYARSSSADERELPLRIIAVIAAMIVVGWAAYGATLTPDWSVEYRFVKRLTYPAFSASLILWWCIPLVARAIGWRNVKRPRDLWVRSVLLPFFPFALFPGDLGSRSPIVYGNCVVMTLLLVAGFTLERRSVPATRRPPPPIDVLP